MTDTRPPRAPTRAGERQARPGIHHAAPARLASGDLALMVATKRTSRFVPSSLRATAARYRRNPRIPAATVMARLTQKSWGKGPQ